jgi:hypothetical protein
MNDKEKNAWKKNYTWVLIANAIYILLFVTIKNIFS